MIRSLFLVLIAYRAYVYFFLFLAVLGFPELFSLGNYHANVFFEPRNNLSFLKTWDAQHYLQLAREGYEDQTHSAGFFPLWPKLIGFFYQLGFDELLISLCLVNVFSVAFILFFFLLCKKDFGEKIAFRSTLIFLAVPSAVFTFFPYSESLFMFLVMLLFFGIRQRKIGLAVLAACLIPMTRAIGVFIFLPIFYEVFWGNTKKSFKKSDRYFLILAPFLGVLFYFLWIFIETGNPIASFEAQAFYSAKRSILNFFNFKLHLMNLFDVRSFHEMQYSFFDRALFLGLLASLPAIWKLNRTYFMYSLALGVFPPLMGSFMSYSRYQFLVFPLWILLGKVFSEKSRELWFYLFLAAAFSMQIAFLLMHSNNHWVG